MSLSNIKIGYPCINYRINAHMRTFRLSHYSLQRHIDIIKHNLGALQKILEFNSQHGIQFFRISSQIIPFASHSICEIDWQKYFKIELLAIEKIIHKNQMRISMHPDQFIILNSLNPDILTRSIAELTYHAQFLDSLKLDETAKVQIHVGGVYDNKTTSMIRFCQNYQKLPKMIKKRLVIENDDRLYSVRDCYEVYKHIKIPIIFDNFHHERLNNQESMLEALLICLSTWRKIDGRPMIDYSQQQPKSRLGKHAQHLNKRELRNFLWKTAELDFDLMLEIKDKEKSAFQTLKILESLKQKI